MNYSQMTHKMRSRTQQDAAIFYMYTQRWIQRVFPGEREAEIILSVQISIPKVQKGSDMETNYILAPSFWF